MVFIKVCSICNENKELTEYYTQKKYNKEKGNWIYYNPECKECTKKRSTKFIKDNPEKFKAYQKKENQKEYKKKAIGIISKEFRESGKYLEWQRDNKDRLKEYANNRQHKSHTITKDEWNHCKEYFNNQCAYCGLYLKDHYNLYRGQLKLTDFHKEHVEHNGSNGIENCVPSCKVCNSSKRTAILEKWYTVDNPNYSAERLNKIYEWLNTFKKAN